MRIKWNELSRSEFEDLVGVLLSRTHNAKRLDGAGGDGGRDFHFKDRTGYHIFEAKAFVHGRLANGGRKRQITRSFERALRHDPTSWTLIFGIDPTPKEEEWLDRIGEESKSRVAWHGRTWLEEQLARFPDIVRYFTSDARGELLQELGGLARMESAALTRGVVDIASQLGDFAKRTNELSPHWDFQYSFDGASVTTSLRPKYQGAEHDAPLSIQVLVEDPSAARKFAEAMTRLQDYGVPLELTGEEAQAVLVTPMPAALLGDEFRPDRIIVRPVARPVDLTLIAAVVDDDGSELQMQTMRVIRSAKGGKGISFYAENESGTFGLGVQIDQQTKSFTLSFAPKVTTDSTPAEMSRVFAWLDELYQGREIQVRNLDGGAVLFSGKATATPSPFSTDRSAFAGLHRLQKHSGVDFPAPEELTGDDLAAIEVGVQLLNSGSAEVPWTTEHLNVTLTGDIEGLLGGRQQLVIDQTVITLPVAGHRLPIGMGRIHYPDVLVSNASDVRTAKPGADVTLDLIPGTNGSPYFIYLLPEASTEAQAS